MVAEAHDLIANGVLEAQHHRHGDNHHRQADGNAQHGNANGRPAHRLLAVLASVDALGKK